MLLLSICIIVLIAPKWAENARILAVMPTPSYSHQIVFNPLWLSLNNRGHHITLWTTDPIQAPNLSNFRQVNWNHSYYLWHEKHNASDIILNFRKDLLTCLLQYSAMMKEILTTELAHPDVQSILNDANESFDLVIVEVLTPAMMALSWRFNAPFIAISPMDVTNFIHNALGNPTSPGLFSDFLTPFDEDMGFGERVLNTFMYLGARLYFKFVFFPENDGIVGALFKGVPPLEAIQRNASMVFLNTNPIIHGVRPLVGNVLSMGGGSHFKSSPDLPDNVARFLQDSDFGVIYFSMGTNVKSKDLPRDFVSSVYDVFKELPYGVLWKFEGELPGVASNILVQKWLPQQAILGHPKTKLFITQGGLQSLEEAIYHAVPIVGIPVYVDQFSNVRRVTKKGLGRALNYEDLNKEQLQRAIIDVLTNRTYFESAKKLSALFRARPNSSIDEAVKWAEYVIKYKGARFLKPPEVPLYQYLLLDVILFFVLLSSMSLFLCFRVCCQSKRKIKSN